MLCSLQSTFTVKTSFKSHHPREITPILQIRKEVRREKAVLPPVKWLVAVEPGLKAHAVYLQYQETFQPSSADTDNISSMAQIS